MSDKKNIVVFAHWEDFLNPVLMGTLTATGSRGKETFSFEYAKEWLNSKFTHTIDPDLQHYAGRYFPRNEKSNFGAFLDSCPDRWGRVLMDRKEAVMARKEKRPLKHLLESDYLLGVYDEHRMGALRFKLNVEGSFLNDDKNMAAPPFTSLRELEHASLKFEEDNIDDKKYIDWINLLIAPGSSLGGARPKASVTDDKGHLWIAKFPSIKDEKNTGAWEMTVNALAAKAGLNVAEGDVKKFNNKHHTYLTKRFDRNKKNRRIHFASAMTLLGYTDGAGKDTGVSYLELVEFITRHGANTHADLEELWRRIVFYICVKNTDDHLRNHGFLLTSQGWRLSPAYDINPNEYGTGLSLNISEKDNSLDIDLALSVADYFRVNKTKAGLIIKRIQNSVALWRETAKQYGISKSEQERMSRAFE
ncbi:MAG: type II toxin-antitoxin system HipA family toxin [Bacteroidetes bacterium]|nr:type II toxin-antitoxin system HipA family toxin [Bacteroidota bacterium]